MDKKEFVNLVSHPSIFSSQDRGWLKAQLSRYPYSSVVRTLALLADHAHGYDTDVDRRAAALSVCDAAALDALLASATQRSHSEPAPTQPRPLPEPTPTPPQTNPDPEPIASDILNEINTFREVSFKTAPKSEILSNFLQTDAQEEEKKPAKPRTLSVLDDKKSLQVDASLGTETLAVILEQQGKFDKALAIYKNLLARNPEKSSIFAPRIEKLEQQINSK